MTSTHSTTDTGARDDEILAARLRDEVETLLEDEVMSEPARVLAALVATDVVEFKIAILRPVTTARRSTASSTTSWGSFGTTPVTRSFSRAR